MAKYRRTQKLPKRKLQLKLTFIFVGLCALGLLLQYLLFMASVSEAAMELPHDSTLLMEQVNGLLFRVLGISALVILPLTLVVGILTTFRIAGPIYRFEKFLESVARGERPQACRLRNGDDLVDFCELLNRVTEPLRAPANDAAAAHADLTKNPPAESPAPASALPAATAAPVAFTTNNNVHDNPASER